MGKGWTDERRAKQAEACRRNKPWKKATGPKSAKGKKRSSMNALKHGNRMRSLAKLQLNDILRLNKLFIARSLLFATTGMREMNLANELIENRLKSMVSLHPQGEITSELMEDTDA